MEEEPWQWSFPGIRMDKPSTAWLSSRSLITGKRIHTLSAGIRRRCLLMNSQHVRIQSSQAKDHSISHMKETSSILTPQHAFPDVNGCPLMDCLISGLARCLSGVITPLSLKSSAHQLVESLKKAVYQVRACTNAELVIQDSELACVR
jgi:hypothetical protein